jgi:hypothetical protein
MHPKRELAGENKITTYGNRRLLRFPNKDSACQNGKKISQVMVISQLHGKYHSTLLSTASSFCSATPVKSETKVHTDSTMVKTVTPKTHPYEATWPTYRFVIIGSGRDVACSKDSIEVRVCQE